MAFFYGFSTFSFHGEFSICSSWWVNCCGVGVGLFFPPPFSFIDTKTFFHTFFEKDTCFCLLFFSTDTSLFYCWHLPFESWTSSLRITSSSFLHVVLNFCVIFLNNCHIVVFNFIFLLLLQIFLKQYHTGTWTILLMKVKYIGSSGTSAQDWTISL